MSLKKNLSILFVVILVIGSVSLFYWYGSSVGFSQYLKNVHQKRMHPNLIPSENMVRLASVGHELSYADFLWISLIQYVGDNIEDSAYLTFSTRMLDTITRINPQFAPGYEWALLLYPIPQNSLLEYDEAQKQAIQAPVAMGIRGMSALCDSAKLHTITHTPISLELWQDKALRNPCKSGLLPYYIAFYGGQLVKNAPIAEQYYTIAGMQDDAPEVSQILAVLSSAPEDDPRSIATKFSLLAVAAYDQDPYSCHTLANDTLEHLQRGPLTPEWIRNTEEQESRLSPSTSTDVTES